ncbi:MAG TPA: hypothetical protein VNT60_06330, partial [Deinococcales bacterium]|nr:hypothetical protein [Deinococcales bacterium]
PDNITVALAQVRETGEASGHYPLPVLDESSEPRSLDPEPDARGTLVLEPPRRSSRRRTAALAVSAVALAALAA